MRANEKLHMRKQQAIMELKQFAIKYFENYFIIIFGSYALSKQKNNSDLDLICYMKQYSSNDLLSFKSFFISLCEGLEISTKTQIPIERSIVISYKDLSSAINGSGFIKDGNNKIIIPEKEQTREFYNSDMMRYRFAFNSITTLNEFISGDYQAYKFYTNRSIEYLLGYIFMLNNLRALTLEELIELTMMDSNSGKSQRMFLGYMDYIEVREHLKKMYLKLLDELCLKNFVNRYKHFYKPSDNWINKIMTGYVDVY